MFLGMSKVFLRSETALSKRLLLLPDFPCCGGSRMFLGMSKVMRTAVPSVLGLGEWQITWVCHDNHDNHDDDVVVMVVMVVMMMVVVVMITVTMMCPLWWGRSEH